ncbi:hypothetical protein ACIBL3_45130 [Kribbella sp. NPDC050124]|uniref:hypothetical protein n=1 Tax=Kribbella sp. NPDC050124 TaxID=3364114 RepID=UPI0037883254
MASRGGRALVAAVVVCASGFQVGCGPPIDGLMGLTVDEAGQPVAVMQTCEHVDGVTIYAENPLASPSQSPNRIPVATWVRTPAASGYVQFPLSGGGEWKLQGTRKKLRPGTEYSLHAWSNEGSPRTGHTRFSLAGLMKLRYGEVRLGGAFADPDTSVMTTPLTTFQTVPCS